LASEVETLRAERATFNKIDDTCKSYQEGIKDLEDKEENQTMLEREIESTLKSKPNATLSHNIEIEDSMSSSSFLTGLDGISEFLNDRINAPVHEYRTKKHDTPLNTFIRPSKYSKSFSSCEQSKEGDSVQRVALYLNSSQNVEVTKLKSNVGFDEISVVKSMEPVGYRTNRWRKNENDCKSEYNSYCKSDYNSYCKSDYKNDYKDDYKNDYNSPVTFNEAQDGMRNTEVITPEQYLRMHGQYERLSSKKNHRKC